MILEFPAFVLIGTYCPATRDESRDEFRVGFLDALDARVRNLVALGKRVFLTGDLNIMREEIDTANVDEMLKKRGVTVEEFFSSSSRRMLNQLLVGGKVYGEREEGREKPVMWDICRSFHPTRKGMFTCWEQKINARPGNFGSRIDYVLCSEDWKDWFLESDIQEGLMGSDHCPVYATLKQKVEIDGKQVDIRDLMSDGIFKDGQRQREWSSKDLLPMSAKLIPEFDRRRNIRDMFARKPSLLSESSQKKEEFGESTDSQASNTTYDQSQSNGSWMTIPEVSSNSYTETRPKIVANGIVETSNLSSAQDKPSAKRSGEAISPLPQKRGKVASKTAKGQPPRGQSSLKGFFKPKDTPTDTLALVDSGLSPIKISDAVGFAGSAFTSASEASTERASTSPRKSTPAEEKPFVDPIVAKESWSKLLSKRIVPRCEHNEPCVSFVTKKAGINCGRSFYMCPRPLGPSGQKEKNTQWRCGTFIWSSDWTTEGA